MGFTAIAENTKIGVGTQLLGFGAIIGLAYCFGQNPIIGFWNNNCGGVLLRASDTRRPYSERHTRTQLLGSNVKNWVRIQFLFGAAAVQASRRSEASTLSEKPLLLWPELTVPFGCVVKNVFPCVKCTISFVKFGFGWQNVVILKKKPT